MEFQRIAAALALVLMAAPGVPAQSQAAAPTARPSKPAAAGTATGEVLEIDLKEQRVLIRHGPIASLGMDAMTMEFLVPDRALLQRLKAGDRIRFAAVWRKGEYEITRAQVTARKAVAR